eukprot:7965502-Ditylum_brightwellii.AAC.1
MAAICPIPASCCIFHKTTMPGDNETLCACHPSKAGFNQNMAGETIYGASKYGKFQMAYLYLKQ